MCNKGSTLTCVLWEGYADELQQFIQGRTDADDEPIVLAVQFGAISKYQGVNRVTTLKHMPKIFINPNTHSDDFITSSRREVGDQSAALTLTATSSENRSSNPCEWLNPLSARTLKELLNCSEPGFYNTFVKMVDVDINARWYYNTCNKCNKQVDGVRAGDICPRCGKNIGAIMPRFKVRLVVKDETSEAFIIVWEDAAKEILGKSAADVLDDLSKNGEKEAIPVDFDKFLERECLLKLKVQGDNNAANNKNQDFSVVKLTEDESVVSHFLSLINTNEVASKMGCASVKVQLEDNNEDALVDTKEDSSSNSVGFNITHLRNVGCKMPPRLMTVR